MAIEIRTYSVTVAVESSREVTTTSTNDLGEQVLETTTEYFTDYVPQTVTEVIECPDIDLCTPEDELEPDEEPGTGTATIDGDASVFAGPGEDAEVADANVSGDVTITGQTIPDADGEVYYQIEYEVEGETHSGWLSADQLDDVDIDWRDTAPIELFDTEGAALSATDADNFAIVMSAQQELLEEYGIDVAMPVERPANGQAPTFRPFTPDDAEVMLEVLEQVQELEGEGGYGIDLEHGPQTNTIAWTPDEIGAVYEAVTSAANTAYDRAIELGHDVESPEQVFRDLYINGPNDVGGDGTLVIQRENRSTFSSGAYAWNYGGNTIGLSHSAFYNSGRASFPAGDFMPDFTPAELIAHELGHQIRGWTDPAYLQTGTHTLEEDWTITYTDDEGTIVTEVIPAGTEIDLDALDDGYRFGARSSNSEVEVETDAITAYVIDDSYAFGAGYDRDDNLLAIARMEQGQAYMDQVLLATYGEPTPPEEDPPPPPRVPRGIE